MKKCTKCKTPKELEYFSKNKALKDGYNIVCKNCVKEYKDSIKEEVKEYNKAYKKDNKDRILNNSRNYYVSNKEKIINYQKQHYQDNREIINKKNNNYKNNVWKNKDSYYKEYKIKNGDHIKNYMEKYNSKEDNIKRRNFLKRERYNSDFEYKLYVILRSCFHQALKRYKTNKSKRIIELIGCTIEFLKKYLEALFTPEMSWENHGMVWEIDHIVACSNFDLSKPEEQAKCFHYTNLQPLFKTTAIAEQYGYYNHIGNRNKSNKNI